MASSQHLAAVRAYLRTKYPDLHLNQDWVQDATEYVTSSTPGVTLSALQARVHHELLHADLAALIDAGHRVRKEGGFDSSLQPRTEGGVSQAQHAWLASSEGSKKQQGLMVQIVGMTDIGVSKQTLLDITRSRIMARQTEMGRKLLADDAADVRVRDTRAATAGPEAADETTAEITAEEQEAVATGIKYPRSMLLLELDDGMASTAEERATNVDAPVAVGIEMERIDGLRMGSTQLGCKLLLRNVEVRQGKLLLRKSNVHILGGSAFELQEGWEQRYVTRLEKELSLPPTVPPRTVRPPSGTEGSQVPARTTVATHPVPNTLAVDDDSDGLLDDGDDAFFATVPDNILRPATATAAPPPTAGASDPIVLSD